jgi:Putative Ig domain
MLTANCTSRTQKFGLLLLVGATTLAGCVGNTVKSSQTPQPAVVAQILAVVPTSLTAGTGAVQLQIAGTNFDATTTVLWNGVARQTVFLNTGTLTAGISAVDVANPGTATISATSVKYQSVSNGMTLNITPAAAAVPLKISTNSLSNGQVDLSYLASLVATGGTPPYHWSVATGALPNGLAIDSVSGVISGMPANAGSFGFAIGVQDSSASRASAQTQMSVQIASAPNPPVAATGTNYGPGIGSDGLGNTTIGPNKAVSYRMRVRHSGNIAAIHAYLMMDSPGYWAGTGGEILVSIQTDDGTPSHNPTGQKLTSSLLPNPDAVPVPARYFPVFTLSAPAAVSAGQIYHIVFENPDMNPTVNYVSVNALYQAAAPKPSQPTMTDTDCAVLLYTNQGLALGTVWQPRQGYTPIVQMDYDDGFTDGIGYMEVWVGAPQSISGNGSVRETFTVSGTSKTVSSVSVRAARLSGTADLIVRLEAGDGTLIEQGTIAATSIPLSSSATYFWANYKFSAPHTLASGQSYNLILQSASSTVYQAFPIRKGTSYGFKNTTFFPDGYAQFQQAGSWVGWTAWGATNRTDGDLQFYFAP